MVDALVSTQWLADHLDDPQLRIFDCTVYMGYDPKSGLTVRAGYDEYKSAHIPSASFLNLFEDLSDQDSDIYFMMPSAEQFNRVLSNAGLGNQHLVVVYSSSPVVYWATRIWWMLRANGFTNVAVLDGGLPKWQLDGFETKSGVETYPPATFTSNPDPSKWASKEQVLEDIENGAVCTLNTLSQESHLGLNELDPFAQEAYKRKGRIQGSANLPYASLLSNDGTFKPLDTLQSYFAETDVFDKDRIIAYCGAGLSSTMAAFTLHRLGYDNVAIYDGSLNEWGHDESLPMETG
jgi:thiosulfate/3-mercaptopyruvate sulfurtransferase